MGNKKVYVRNEINHLILVLWDLKWAPDDHNPTRSLREQQFWKKKDAEYQILEVQFACHEVSRGGYEKTRPWLCKVSPYYSNQNQHCMTRIQPLVFQNISEKTRSEKIFQFQTKCQEMSSRKNEFFAGFDMSTTWGQSRQ